MHNYFFSFFLAGITHALADIAAKEKLRGLYKGVGPTLLAIVPFIAIQQSSYDVMKQYALGCNLQPSISLFLLCGSLAGVVAQTVSTIVFENDMHGVYVYLRLGCYCLHSSPFSLCTHWTLLEEECKSVDCPRLLQLEDVKPRGQFYDRLQPDNYFLACQLHI